MLLSEALKQKNIRYLGTRENYKIHDLEPHILIIDDDYNVDGNGKSILAFNLDYLDHMSKKQKQNLVNRINKLDNKITDVSSIKGWLMGLFNQGNYGLTKNKKIKRYREIIEKFPELKKVVRRYKYRGIEK